jgi:hypothetical protein
VVATFDGASLTLFVDGQKTQVTPDARSQAPKPVSAFIGADPALSTADVMVGVIDEVAIYDKALDAARVASHFRAAGAH